jgi:hypothetical protein
MSRQLAGTGRHSGSGAGAPALRARRSIRPHPDPPPCTTRTPNPPPRPTSQGMWATVYSGYNWATRACSATAARGGASRSRAMASGRSPHVAASPARSTHARSQVSPGGGPAWPWPGRVSQSSSSPASAGVSKPSRTTTDASSGRVPPAGTEGSWGAGPARVARGRVLQSSGSGCLPCTPATSNRSHRAPAPPPLRPPPLACARRHLAPVQHHVHRQCRRLLQALQAQPGRAGQLRRHRLDEAVVRRVCGAH